MPANLDEARDWGNRIRAYRTKKKLSQMALAGEAGISQTYLSQIENGKRRISLEILKKIANALQISEEMILGSKHICDEVYKMIDEMILEISLLQKEEGKSIDPKWVTGRMREIQKFLEETKPP